jgi:hypothetical protein
VCEAPRIIVQGLPGVVKTRNGQIAGIIKGAGELDDRWLALGGAKRRLIPSVSCGSSGNREESPDTTSYLGFAA